MNLVIGIAIFITLVLLIEGSIFAVRALHNPERKKLRRRLQQFSAEQSDGQTIDIVRRRVLSDVPWFNAVLLKTPGMPSIGRLLEQADCRYSVGTFLSLSAFLALTGLLIGSFLIQNMVLQVIGAGLCGFMPFLYAFYKKQQRLQKFLRQLPEALDLIARALRAGHTFQVGLKMVGEEFPDPLGTEFDKTLAEINFGAGIPEALKNLARRVDCPDLHFFVVAILIQRETGGNLAEIAENIAHLIRKRFELQDRVRALAAEGKLSAIIMFVLPFFLALAISVLNPKYLSVLFTDPIGKGMVGIAAVIMVIGAIAVKKMIHIRV
ncbi:MAG TPA: type II secretion system F family protein [Alphaproteobacteria bacterium]|nr:type II secretion system F family protein [Alphaproteobacteria bacterium]